ncbi:MAG: protein translocase subunit SecD [bacterium]|nr:protein translocase subunit SecD [bacterium]
MTTRQKLWLSILGIVVLAVLSGVVDYPKGPDITWKGDMVRELKVHLGLDLQGGTSLVYEADLSNITEGEEQEAMAGIRDVLERRVNAFGVSEPLVQTNRAGDSWRVLIELPGITDINRAVEEIGETPLLEFKTEGATELSEEQLASIRKVNEESKVTAQAILDRVQGGEDFSEIAIAESVDTVSGAEGGDLGYFARGDMVPEFEDVAFAGEVGAVIPELVETEFGFHIIRVDDKAIGNPDELNSQDEAEVSEENVESPEEVSVVENTPADAVAIEDAENNTDVDSESNAEEVVRASHILIGKVSENAEDYGIQYENTELTGKQLKRADVVFDQNTTAPIVSLSFDSEGSKLFEQITSDNIGKTIAIYLDGVAISTPVVNQVISGGEAVIEGNFDIEEARTLSRRLNAGALPVDINLVNQRNIGPTLGEEAIQRSVVAGLLGVIILAFFMVAYYRLPGLVAVVALSIYGLVLLAIFKLWPITLTLSGVAGFILSLGIAVDANVLIFERLKEELRNGKSLEKAIDDGFKRAWLSIRDSNMSSLITCLILIWFGTSVIKGFAITLSIGIVLSMFSAITITRNILKIVPIKNTRLFGVKR